MKNEDLPIHTTSGCPFCSCPRDECEETNDYVERDGVGYYVCRCTWEDHKWLDPGFVLPLSIEEDGTVSAESLEDALAGITSLLTGGRR